MQLCCLMFHEQMMKQNKSLPQHLTSLGLESMLKSSKRRGRPLAHGLVLPLKVREEEMEDVIVPARALLHQRPEEYVHLVSCVEWRQTKREKVRPQ